MARTVIDSWAHDSDTDIRLVAETLTDDSNVYDIEIVQQDQRIILACRSKGHAVQVFSEIRRAISA